jgi:hypothetical protein
MAKGILKTSKTFDDFGATFQDRLEVLGRAQGLLVRTYEGGRVTFDELINTELAAQSVPVGERWTGHARWTERHSSALPHSPIARDGLARAINQCSEIRCTQATECAPNYPLAAGDLVRKWQAFGFISIGKKAGWRCRLWVSSPKAVGKEGN